MTFTIKLKEEISKFAFNELESNAILSAYLLAIGKISSDKIELISENASVTRLVYKLLKNVYNVNPSVDVRIQKKFKVKQIYILNVKEKIATIKDSLDLYKNNILEILPSDEEKTAFLLGAFLATGTVSDPKSKGYHLEYAYSAKIKARNIYKLLIYYKFNVNMTKRGNKYVVYIKAGENISDLIKMFKAYNALFAFEDIRIYRDHKNMVNRLNNCEIANQEKSIKTGMKQLENITYLKEHDLINLLDDNLKIVIEYREKYPEASLAELADIISGETDYKIGKSGINHQFIKVNKIIKKNKEVNNEN